MLKHNHKNLQIWRIGIDLVEGVYEYASTIPDREKFGLWSQITRSAVSIPSNIAEGSARSSDKHFIQYLEAALGSPFELETQLLICHKRSYGDSSQLPRLFELISKEQKMIMSFTNSLKTN